MSPLVAGALTMALVLASVGTAGAQRDRSLRNVSEFALIGDDGQRVANHSVPAEQARSIEQLPGVVVIGNPRGKVVLAEFYDLNCPYCRIAAGDVDDMIETDSDLKLLLVPFPVLGVASVQAGRVELAVGKLGSPKQFYEFHRRLFARRGTIDGARALEVARELRLDEAKLIALADSEAITETMKSHVRLGNALGLAATPSFVVGGVAILGHPGRRSLQSVVDAVGACGRILC
jgi:protein-disulfide isomerase